MEDQQTILSELQSFTTPTTQYHDWNIVGNYRMKLSDGVMCLRRAEGCESLIMRIALTQHDNGLAIRSYKITTADGQGELSAWDSSGSLLGTVVIEGIEFPLSEVELYCDHDMLMLSSER